MIVKVHIDGQDIYLEQQENGTWERVATAPYYAGKYPITITVTEKNGSVTIVGSDDPVLGKLLTLMVLGKSISAQRMIEYLPVFLRTSDFIKTIFEAEGIEIDRLQDDIDLSMEDGYIQTASEERIRKWEQKLKIIPSGTLEQRKQFLLATLRGQGKLNEERIKMVVKAFTGGDATVTFDGSVINVKVLPPSIGDVYLFPDVERALLPRIPAHIGLSVQRWYSSWNDIKQNFSSWESLKTDKTDWSEVKNYLPPI